MNIEFNEEQIDTIERTIDWWKRKHKPSWEISGPAGSGKTTLVYTIMERLGIKHENVVFMAFVGKAAMELQRKGNNAKTIHSTIYNLEEIPILDESGQLTFNSNGKVKKRPSFVKKPYLPNNIELLVLDEGGMVNKEIALDILSYGIPLLVLGDLNQLPPVIGEPYFLVNPDCILRKPMRQKENSPIIKLSQMAINGEEIPFGEYGDNCKVIPEDEITDKMLLEADIILCGRNSTRDGLNNYIRKVLLKRKTDIPYIGDKVICRQNNWNLSILDDLCLINGMNGTIEGLYLDSYNGKKINIDFKPDFLDFEYFKNIPIDFPFLFMNFEEKKMAGRGYVNRFEFGWAITTHLSQGSQYDKVLIIDEKMGTKSYYKKWLYTAITRAKKEVWIARPVK